MKLARCDSCGNVLPDTEICNVVLKEGNGDGNIYKLDKHNEPINIDRVQADVCLKCAIDIAKIIRPFAKWLPIEEYPDNVKSKYQSN